MKFIPPEPIKTKKRCQYSLPGMHYNCRSIGRFVLNGKGYCASHHHITWRAIYPEYGQQHEWHFHVNRYNGSFDEYESCKRCGYVRQREGLPQGPCDGKMAEIVLR